MFKFIRNCSRILHRGCTGFSFPRAMYETSSCSEFSTLGTATFGTFRFSHYDECMLTFHMVLFSFL